MFKNNKLIFIDGITRSGKSALCQTIITIRDVEHIDINFDFQFIFSGLVKKKINIEFANEFLKSSFARYVYDRKLGRNLNFRKEDFSSIYNSYNPKLYLKRLKLNNKHKFYHFKKTTKKKEYLKDQIIDDLKSKSLYFPFQTHYFLENLSVLKKLDLNFKLIRVDRHPVDNIYSYYKRGWGKIHKKDTYFYFANASYHTSEKKIIKPWYVYANENKYLKLNDMNRCIITIVNNLERVTKIRENKKILIINFDNFCTNPKKELNRVCKFLSSKIQSNYNLFLSRANLPRKINFKEREKKYNFIVKNSKNPKLIQQLDRQIKIFEQNK